MHLGLQLVNLTTATEQEPLGVTFTRVVEQAERVGFYSLWTMDHVLYPSIVGQIEQEILEGWSALTFAAAHTTHIKLGVLVSAVNFRFPGLLVKTATTLDVLSQGRSYFGIGAAWFEEENHAYGIPFPPLKERYERLEECLQIAKHMWSGDTQPYKGKHYQLAHPLHSPNVLQNPHPPILIAGGGERKTLPLVARYGNACNLFTHGGKEELQHKLKVLRTHCDAIGRPFADIEKTTKTDDLLFSRTGRKGTLSPTAAIDFFAELAELGIDHAIINLTNMYETESWELLATEIIPAVEKIPVTGR